MSERKIVKNSLIHLLNDADRDQRRRGTLRSNLLMFGPLPLHQLAWHVRMPTGQTKVLFTDCCSDMYGLLDWACSESFLVALLLVVLGVVVVWKLFAWDDPDDDADGLQEASQKFNLSLKTSQRSRRLQDNRESSDNVRWSVSVEEINVKLSLDHTLEHARKRTVSQGSLSERTDGEHRSYESNATALSTTTCSDLALKEREEDSGEPMAGAVASVTVDEMNQWILEEDQDISPFDHGTATTATSRSNGVNSHANQQCNSKTMSASFGEDGSDLLEARKQHPVEHHSSTCGDIQSLAPISDAHQELDDIKAAICEAGDLDFVPAASLIESSLPSDHDATTDNVLGELNTDEQAVESDDNDWVVV